MTESSGALAIPKSTALSDVEAFLAARASELQKTLTISGNTITIQKNGKFKLPSGEERAVLDMVVLAYRHRNQFYPKPYVRGQYSEPTCQAVGTDEKAMVPHESITEPEAVGCAVCPKNQFGSAANGKGKACQNQLVLAVMFPNLAEDDGTYLIKGSPTAKKDLESFLGVTMASHGHPIKVVSRFTIDSSGDYPILRTQYGGLNPAYAEHFQHMSAADTTLDSIRAASSETPPPAVPSASTKDARGGPRAR